MYRRTFSSTVPRRRQILSRTKMSFARGSFARCARFSTAAVA